MNIEVVQNFKDKHKWRNWLEQNHDKEKEAWLVIFKKHSKQDGLRYDEALEEALCFGWIDGKMKSIDEERFIIRYSPRKAKSLWSKINKEKTELLIAQDRMAPAGLAKVEEAKKNGYWHLAYTSMIKEIIPTDLKKALMEHSTAWNNFKEFANTYHNMYIGWVNGARTDETRKKRIMEVVKRSALNKKAGIE